MSHSNVTSLLKSVKGEREAEFVHGLSKGLADAPLMVERTIEDYRKWKATDDVLAEKTKTAEELRSFGDLAKLVSATVTKAVGRANRILDRSDYVL